MSTNTLEIVLHSSGLDNDGQLQIREAMHPFWAQAMDWQAKVAEVTDPKVARASRLTLKKIRVEAERKKSELKEQVLVRGRAIDAAFRAIESTIVPLEEHLDAIEKAEARRLEAEAKARAELRTFELAALDYRAIGVDLGRLSDADYAALLGQAQAMLAQRQEVARIKAEAEARLAEERRQREEAEARARAEAAAREAIERKARAEVEAQLRAEREARAKLEREASARAEEERKKAQAEREAAELAARKEREAAEAALRAEREARLKLERESAAKDAEERRKAEALAEERRRLAAAPDAAKIHDWASRLDQVKAPAVTTAEAQELVCQMADYLATGIQEMHYAAQQLAAGRVEEVAS